MQLFKRCTIADNQNGSTITLKSKVELTLYFNIFIVIVVGDALNKGLPSYSQLAITYNELWQRLIIFSIPVILICIIIISASSLYLTLFGKEILKITSTEFSIQRMYGFSRQKSYHLGHFQY